MARYSSGESRGFRAGDIEVLLCRTVYVTLAGCPRADVSPFPVRQAEPKGIALLGALTEAGPYATTGELPGNAGLHPFAIATAIVQPSAVSHWSALDHHGLTTQVPRVVTCMTTRKVVTPSMRSASSRQGQGRHRWETASGLRTSYTTVTPAHDLGIEEVWVDQRSRDYFDLWKILTTFAAAVDPSTVRRILPAKCALREVSFTGTASFFTDRLTLESRKHWVEALADLIPDLLPVERVLDELPPLVSRLLLP